MRHVIPALLALLFFATPALAETVGFVDSDGKQKTVSSTTPLPVTTSNAITPLPVALFTRPANTTAYVSGQMVANSTTAGSVTPMPFTVNLNVTGRPITIRRAIMTKSSTGVTAPNFRLHLFNTLPTPGAGDGATFASTSVGHFCDIDIFMNTVDPWSDGNDGIGTPNNGAECFTVPPSQSVYGLLEARGAYAPASGETISVTLEVH